MISPRTPYRARRVPGVTATSGSAILTATPSSHLRTRAPRNRIVVLGAGVDGAPLVSTVVSATDANTITLADVASTSVADTVAIVGADVSSDIQAAAVESVLAGTYLLLPPGDYLLASPVVMPSSLHLVGTPHTFLWGGMAQTGGETANPLHTEPPTATASSTLYAAAVRGDTTISVADPVVSKGSLFRIRSIAPEGNNQVHYFEARSVSGSGPRTVTLDRPLEFTFIVGSVVDVVASRPTNIRIDGNGMSLGGSGDTGIQFWGASRCRVEGVQIIGAFANWALTSDLGSDRMRYADLHASGDNHGLACSSNRDTVFDGCTVVDSLGCGFYLWDGVDIVLRNGTANRCAQHGVNIYSNGNEHAGQHVRIEGGNFDCNQAGIVNAAASGAVVVIGASAKYCSAYGIANLAAGTTLDVIDCDVGPGVDSDQAVAVSGAGYSGLPALYAGSGGRLRARGGRVLLDGPSASGASNQIGALANASSVVELSGVELRLDSSSAGISNVLALVAGDGGGVVSVDGCRIHGEMSGASVFAFVTAATGTIRIGRVDVDAVSSGNRYYGAGYFSRTKTVDANGSTPVVVAWPDIKSTDRVEFTPTALDGTPTPHKPLVSITPGTGFSVTFAAGDSGTYEYQIQ